MEWREVSPQNNNDVDKLMRNYSLLSNHIEALYGRRRDAKANVVGFILMRRLGTKESLDSAISAHAQLNIELKAKENVIRLL